MKVTIIGAGSAGLGTAITLRNRLNNVDVQVFERAARDEAPGLGVALLPFGLNELKMLGLDDFADYRDSGITIDKETRVFAGIHGGPEFLTRTRFQETSYWGVRRATLLSFLTKAAERASIPIAYDTDISEDRIRREREATDLLVGADGAGSLVRGLYADQFGPVSELARSRFAWMEIEGPLDKFVFGYMSVEGKGIVRITAYPHSRDECSAIITVSPGLTEYFDRPDMVDADGSISDKARDLMSAIFSRGVDGRRLLGKSRWRRFRATQCSQAAFANVALVGDAYATVFYETGWGTSAALQQGRVLGHLVSRNVVKGNSVGFALERYALKSTEIARGLINATSSAMREVDAQSAKFHEVGPAAFLELKTP